jgi:hypothetical protein
MVLGLTRESVSASAVGLGALFGLGVGSLLVPLLLQRVDLMTPEFEWDQLVRQQRMDARAAAQLDNSTSTAEEAAKFIAAYSFGLADSNTTAALASAAAASLPVVITRGYLDTYLHALRHFPSGVLYSDWCTVLVTALVLLTLRLVYNCEDTPLVGMQACILDVDCACVC